MRGKHFLKSYYQSLRTVSVSWCQTVLRTVTCHTRVTKCSPTLIGREPRPCGMRRDSVVHYSKFPDMATKMWLQAGHFWLWNHQEGGWEGSPWHIHERGWGKADTAVCQSVSEPEGGSPRPVKRNEEVTVLIWGRSKGWPMWGNRLSCRRAGEMEAMREQGRGKKENCRIS